MFKYVLKRLGLAFISIFIILSLTFILMKMLPYQVPVFAKESEVYAFFVQEVQRGYVVDFSVPMTGYGDPLWPVAYIDPARKVHYWYAAPISQQYFSWLKGIITEWNWGVSTKVQVNTGAIHIIAARLPQSMKINISIYLLQILNV